MCAMADKVSKYIVLASGGTGGHIFPAHALAEELHTRGWKPLLITDRRYKAYGEQPEYLEYQVIRSSTISGNLLKRVGGLCNLGVGYLQARSLLRRFRPAVVVGFGGYPSFPTMCAAVRNGFRTVIHEQNSMVGRANYILTRKVDKIATSFPDVTGITEEDIEKVMFTGNPVRSTIKSLRQMSYLQLQEGGTLQILVIGGSQGASVFSKVVPEAIVQLPEELRKRIRIDQQCREVDIDTVRNVYNDLGVSADLSTFFRDIPSRLAAAHLVITRAGASTIAELAVSGRPAILVPYPHAQDNHQTVNANALEDIGGGWLMPEQAFVPEALANKLESFLNLPETLNQTAEKARLAGKPDADKALADLVEQLAADRSLFINQKKGETQDLTLDELEHSKK